MYIYNICIFIYKNIHECIHIIYKYKYKYIDR